MILLGILSATMTVRVFERRSATPTMMVASEACMVDPASLKMFGVLLSMMLMPVNWRKNMRARAMRKGRRTPRAQKSRGRSERLSCNADEVFFEETYVL